MYGWKLNIATTVAEVWLPPAAELTPANAADNNVAPALLWRIPAEVRFVPGDTHYNDPGLRDLCGGRALPDNHTSRSLPHTDDGVDVRCIVQKLRSTATEHVNEQFNGIFDGHRHVPTKGLVNTRRFALGSIFV